MAPISRMQEPLASGNLASSRRTITGVQGQLAMAGMSDDAILAIVRLVGLPARALEDPEFPISLEQELRALTLMLEQLRHTTPSVAGFAIETFSRVGINHYGVLGLTIQHAPDTLAAIRVLLAHPELSWGHSRIVVSRAADTVRLAFDMETPLGDTLREYCITRDLVSVERLIGDILDRQPNPILVTLPFAEPSPPGPDPGQPGAWLPCPIRFGDTEASIHYPAAILEAVPVHASEMAFKRYQRLTRQFASLLADDTSITEQVSRLLWAYTPPPSRDELAAMLTRSTRTLARKLRDEGTSYNELLRRVHSERATNFLRHSSMSIARIAEQMGYSDPAAFTRAFESWTGVTPSRWRARHRSPASPSRCGGR